MHLKNMSNSDLSEFEDSVDIMDCLDGSYIIKTKFSAL